MDMDETPEDTANNAEMIVVATSDAPGEYRILKTRPWSNWRYILAVSMLLFTISFMIWAFFSVRSANDSADTLRKVSNQQQVIDEIRRNQIGIDELVKFVHEVETQQQAQQAAGTQSTRDYFTQFLCADSDPLRHAKCVELGIIPP